jgi:hypothetical protein
MLTLPPTVRVFVYLGPADLRRSLDGLAALTREILQEDPLSGHLFVSFNRRRDRVKKKMAALLPQPIPEPRGWWGQNTETFFGPPQDPPKRR